MTDRERVIFKMEGTDENSGHLDLSVLQEKISQFFSLLKSSAKDSGEDGTIFQVVNLSHSSPVTIECEFIGENKLPATLAFDYFTKNLDSVEAGQTSNFSHTTFDAMENLVKSKTKKIARVELQAIGSTSGYERVWKLDDAFRQKLAEARNEDYVQINTVDGKLEAINIHGKPMFKIFTWLPYVAGVRCIFPQEMLEQVMGALGKLVSVSGKCHNRPDSVIPYEIQVREIKVLPPPDKSLSLDDLHGIAPEAIGDKTPEEFVRELRDQWDRNKP